MLVALYDVEALSGRIAELNYPRVNGERQLSSSKSRTTWTCWNIQIDKYLLVILISTHHVV